MCHQFHENLTGQREGAPAGQHGCARHHNGALLPCMFTFKMTMLTRQQDSQAQSETVLADERELTIVQVVFVHRSVADVIWPGVGLSKGGHMGSVPQSKVTRASVSGSAVIAKGGGKAWQAHRWPSRLEPAEVLTKRLAYD